MSINVFAQIIVPLLVLGIGNLNDNYLALNVGVTLSDLSWVPTTVLIIILFKPVEVKVNVLLISLPYTCNKEQY